MPFSVLLPAIFAAAVVATPPVHAAERTFPVTAFDRIIVLASSDVDVRTGVAPSVAASGAPADLERLDIKVEGGALVIGTRKGASRRMSRKPVTIRVTTQTLAAAVVSGSGDMTIDRVEGPFSGMISGSGDMDVGALQFPGVALAITGSGTMRAAGLCGSGAISITGSGNIDASGLRCRTAKACISGSGNVTLSATDTADLRVTGSGNVTLTGGARYTTTTTGSGTIRCG